MIVVDLIDALVDNFQSVFSKTGLNAKGGGVQKVHVYAQYLPQPRAVTVKPKGDAPIVPQDWGPADMESVFPCVIVKFDELSDMEENAVNPSLTSIRFLAGVYDDAPDCQGYRDVLNLLEVMRQELLSVRYIARKYRLETPMKTSLFEDQPWPVFFGQIETVWWTGRPQYAPVPNFDGLRGF